MIDFVNFKSWLVVINLQGQLLSLLNAVSEKSSRVRLSQQQTSDSFRLFVQFSDCLTVLGKTSEVAATCRNIIHSVELP